MEEIRWVGMGGKKERAQASTRRRSQDTRKGAKRQHNRHLTNHITPTSGTFRGTKASSPTCHFFNISTIMINIIVRLETWFQRARHIYATTSSCFFSLRRALHDDQSPKYICRTKFNSSRPEADRRQPQIVGTRRRTLLSGQPRAVMVLLTPYHVIATDFMYNHYHGLSLLLLLTEREC